MTAHPTPERLGAYLDGELDGSARAAVDAHLIECADCGAHLADLAAVDDAARRTPLSVPEGYFDDFAPRVRARLGKRAPARWRPPVWGWAAAAALLLAVVTPLALQERRAAPVAAPGADRRLEREMGSDFKQNEASLPAAAPAVPPATLVAPGALRPAAPPPEQDALRSRAPEARLARRDGVVSSEGGRVGAASAGAPTPKLQAEAPLEPDVGQPAQGTLQDTAKRPEEKKADERHQERTAPGYVPPPPPASQRQYGPRAQNTAPARPGAARAGDDLRKSVPEPKDEEQAQDTVAEKAAAAADAPGAVLQESVEVTPQSRDIGSGLASAKFRSLFAADPPRSAGEARSLREAWRAFVAENPDHPQADEARVRLVEAGVLAYRLGLRPQDREIAQRDASAYLARPATPQAARVRAALKMLEPPAP